MDACARNRNLTCDLLRMFVRREARFHGLPLLHCENRTGLWRCSDRWWAGGEGRTMVAESRPLPIIRQPPGSGQRQWMGTDDGGGRGDEGQWQCRRRPRQAAKHRNGSGGAFGAAQGCRSGRRTAVGGRMRAR